MRTIKFRGKTTDKGEWLYGSLIILNGTYWVQEFEGYRMSRVIPESVGQYIGREDSYNGVEIYEGDIVRYKEYTYIVIHNTLKGGFIFNCIQTAYNIAYRDFNSRELEIIGNTTDNPELTTKN